MIGERAAMTEWFVGLIKVTIEFRLIERAVLTLFVLAACTWLTFKYYSHFTKLKVSDENKSIPNVSVTLGTPILIAILLVGYAYVDLSNPVEVGNLMQPRQSQEHGARSTDRDVTYPGFRGFDEAGRTTQDARRRSDQDDLPPNAPLNDDLRRIFVSLSSMPKSLSPQIDADLLNLALGIECLGSEQSAFPRNFDQFRENKSYEEVRSAIVAAMKSTTFKDTFCQQLRMEFESE